MTDADGAVASVRRSVLVVPEWPLTGTHAPPVDVLSAGLIARPGVPARLSATSPESGVTYTWDADGDGDFDDGTGAQLSFTYPTPGEYTARVKASSAGGTRVGMGTVSVREEPALTPVLSLSVPSVAFTSRAALFDAQAVAADGGPSRAALTYDLDGDGAFDDVPGSQYDESAWTFPAPTTMSVKATWAGARRSVPRTSHRSPGASGRSRTGCGSRASSATHTGLPARRCS